MFIGDDAGCQLVPDPICPIGMRFFALAPTRIAISSPDMTINSCTPASAMLVMPPSMFMPGIAPVCMLCSDGVAVVFAAGDVLGMLISCSPCMFISLVGDAVGVGLAVDVGCAMLGMLLMSGVAVGVGDACAGG